MVLTNPFVWIALAIVFSLVTLGVPLFAFLWLVAVFVLTLLAVVALVSRVVAASEGAGRRLWLRLQR
jgi:hypothetical protein